MTDVCQIMLLFKEVTSGAVYPPRPPNFFLWSPHQVWAPVLSWVLSAAGVTVWHVLCVAAGLLILLGYFCFPTCSVVCPVCRVWSSGVSAWSGPANNCLICLLLFFFLFAQTHFAWFHFKIDLWVCWFGCVWFYFLLGLVTQFQFLAIYYFVTISFFFFFLLHVLLLIVGLFYLVSSSRVCVGVYRILFLLPLLCFLIVYKEKIKNRFICPEITSGLGALSNCVPF